MVECLDDARARNERAEHLTGMLATQINRLDAIGSEWIVRILRLVGVRIEECDGIGGVNDDTAVPRGQTAQRFLEIDPTYSHQHHVSARGLPGGASLDRRAKLACECRERFRTAAVGDRRRNPALCQQSGHAGTEGACPNNANAHWFAPVDDGAGLLRNGSTPMLPSRHVLHGGLNDMTVCRRRDYISPKKGGHHSSGMLNLPRRATSAPMA